MLFLQHPGVEGGGILHEACHCQRARGVSPIGLDHGLERMAKCSPIAFSGGTIDEGVNQFGILRVDRIENGVLLGAEVAKKRAPRDTTGGRQVIDGHLVEPVLARQFEGNPGELGLDGRASYLSRSGGCSLAHAAQS